MMLTFVILFLSVVRSVILGYVVAYLWSLFAVPLGAPVIGALHAWGLVCLVHCGMLAKITPADLSDDPKVKHDRELARLGTQIGHIIVLPLTALIISCVVAWFGPVM